MRYEYAFERCAVRGERHYQDVVHERARDGWRLVQVLVEQPAAISTEYVLVLERPDPAPSS